jgi:ribosome-binding protein aMBF1 (putative translation factor)
MMDEMVYLNNLIKNPQQEEIKELEKLLGLNLSEPKEDE